MKGGKKVEAVICIAAIWSAELICTVLMARFAPEQMTWYRWYAPTIGAIGTLTILAQTGLLK